MVDFLIVELPLDQLDYPVDRLRIGGRVRLAKARLGSGPAYATEADMRIGTPAGLVEQEQKRDVMSEHDNLTL